MIRQLLRSAGRVGVIALTGAGGLVGSVTTLVGFYRLTDVLWPRLALAVGIASGVAVLGVLNALGLVTDDADPPTTLTLK